MRGFPAITLSEQTRRRLGFSCAVLNLLCLVASVVLVALGIYIEVAVKSKVNLIKNYNGQYLPILIIVLGVALICVNGFGWKICLNSRVVHRRCQQQTAIFAYVTLASVLSVIVEVASILCFVQRNQLHISFGKGLRSAMNRYRSDHATKQEIDWLQLKYRCCGNNAYTDWFSTAWISEKYVDVKSENVRKKMSSGAYLNDDVPFSCCNRDVTRPCIHHHVHDNALHYNYDYRLNTTLNEIGCKEKLIAFYGDQLLKNVGIVVMVISIIQGVVCTAARYLQTSIDQSIQKNDPLGPAPGWLVTTSFKATEPDITPEEEEKKLLLQAGYNEDDDDGFASDEFDDEYFVEETTTDEFISEPEYATVEEYNYAMYDQPYPYEENKYGDNNQSAYKVIRTQPQTLRRHRGPIADDNESSYKLQPVRRFPSPPRPYAFSPPRERRQSKHAQSRRYQFVEEY